MPLKRDDDGVWSLEQYPQDERVVQASHGSYIEALPRYLTALDPAFERAREVSEFNFILSILAIRGMQDAGWDPYESSTRAISAIQNVHSSIEGEAAFHLMLWLYGHIMEASEPYEFLANLIDVAVGGRFNVERFPPRRSGAPLSPQGKIERLGELAQVAELRDAVIPMQEAWNRDFRNAIFHADYSLYGPQVRTIRPVKIYDHEEVLTLVNRALAYHEAMSILRRMHIESYAEPTRIPADPEFTGNREEEAVVIVRAEHGATGLKDGWSPEELRGGRIPYRMGRFTTEEMRMLDADPTLALLPARADGPEPVQIGPKPQAQ